MPCRDKHFIPILDELRQREEQTISENQCPSVAKKKRGGPRPGSGPPTGNLNALKHGRFSRRHKIILETILEVPEAREALIGVMKRNRQRQKHAELEAAYLLMRWLATNNPQFLPAALDQAAANLGVDRARSSSVRAEPVEARNDQTQIDQLTASLRRMNESLKRRLLRKTTKKRTPKPKQRPNSPPRPRTGKGAGG
jgi:hypothetical protein